MKKPVFLTHTPSMGDFLCATPTIRKLAEIYQRPITVIANNPVLLKNSPCVEQLVRLEDIDLEKIRKEFDVHETFMLLGKRDGRGIEFKHAMCDIRQFHAKDLGFNLTPEEMTCEYWADSELEFMESLNLPEKYVVIHPAQTWESRTWKRENWQNLVYELEREGIFVVSVGKDDGEYSDHLHQEKPAWDLEINFGLDLTNKTSLDQTWHILANATCVVTMDSGILHLAGTTDTHIIQLGSSIHPSYRAPWRNGSQQYKYSYVLGGCALHCSSNLSYSLRDWGNIQAVTLIHTCLEGKPTFECNPGYDQVKKEVINVFHNTGQPLQTWKPPTKKEFDFKEITKKSYNQKISVSFTRGPKVSIEGDELDPRRFVVNFIDLDKDEIVHEDTIGINHWTRASRKWFTRWRIEVWNGFDLIHSEDMDLKEKTVLIKLGNSSLGDTISWSPYCFEFQKKHQCKIFISSHHYKLLKLGFEDFENFVEAERYDEEDPIFYASYYVGYGVEWFQHQPEMKRLNQNFQKKSGEVFSDKLSVWDEHRTPRNPHQIPLAAVACDILGLDFIEIRPHFSNPKPDARPMNKRFVCISEFASDSTGLKIWQNPIGWQKLVDFLKSEGFEVVSISAEKTNLKNVIKRNGKLDLSDRIWYLHHCEFFIGVSSGLSWLAWACGKKVVMISGATADWNEFKEDNIRIFNPESCHGCWNSHEHSHKFACFHSSFCPEKKNFECTRKISPSFVIDRIKQENLV
jgi:ADP-heptose:LPS heptosyltransferase